MESNMNTSSSSPTSPTAFVQADTNSFKDLVQKLTGLASPSEKLPSNTHPSRLPSKPTPPVLLNGAAGPRRSPFKLQERRHTMRKLEIRLGLTSILNTSPSTNPFSPGRQTYSGDSPVPSPATPAASEALFFPSPGTSSPEVSEEEKAIAEKGFFLHPSPRKSEPPELLTLFPLSSN